MRENRWVIADLRGKGGRIRTVAVPVWVKNRINVWQTATGIEEGPLFRSIRKGGKIGESLSDWAVWAVVTEAAKEIGIENFGAHDLRRTCAKLCRKSHRMDALIQSERARTTRGKARSNGRSPTCRRERPPTNSKSAPTPLVSHSELASSGECYSVPSPNRTSPQSWRVESLHDQCGPNMDNPVEYSLKEQSRLAALESYGVLDSPPERAYDDLTELAAYICETPVSLVSFVGANRQFFKSAHNSALSETPRNLSFCAHTLEPGEALVVEDASQDERFAANLLVTGDPKIRFYAGSPIVTHEGHVLGTLCVIDTKPRQLTSQQTRALESLARQAAELLEQRRLISDQQRSMEAAKKAALQLKLTTDAGKLGIFSWTVHEGTVTWENDRMYDILGRTRDQGSVSATRFIEEIVHPLYVDSFAAAVGLIRKPGDRLYWLGKFLHGDGSVRWIEFQGLAEENPAATLILIGTAFDATERKQVEETLIAERERLQTALSATHATTFDWQLAQDTIEWHGPPPFGRAPEALIDSGSVFSLVHPEDTAGLKKAVNDALEGRAAYMHEFRALWPDNSVHWVRARGEVIRDDSESAVRFIGINLDVTDRKLSEQALLRSEKLAAVGRLASTISHEINNPLEAVTNLLYIVRNSPSLSQADRDHLELADRELGRVGQITAQTLRFHRSPSKATLNDGNQLIHDCLAMYSSRLTASNISVRLDLGEGIMFNAFEGDIRQVLNNLLGNAFDVMRRGGTLRLRTRLSIDQVSHREGVVITIADTGGGIPQDIGVRVFDEFFSTKGINGTGLGLWISKRIVHKHRGKLSFRSRTGQSHGTVFRLWLPLAVASSAAEAWA